MKEETTPNTRGIIYISFICLFLYGFIDNLKGVTLPHVLLDLKITYSTGGLIQQGAYLGFLISTLITGILLQRLKHRNILFIVVACLTTGILVYSISRRPSILLIAMVTIGLGLGFLDLVGIRLITDFYNKHSGRLLNLAAFFHGLSSLIAPLFAGYVIGNSLSWNNVYLLSLLLVGLFLVIIFLVKIPKIRISTNQKNNIQGQFILALHNKKAWAYYILIISYESIEIGLAVWLSEFIITGANLSSAIGISYLSYFFLFITIGRLVGSFIVEHVGYIRMILFSSIGVIICLFFGLFGGAQLVFLVPLSGLFLSSIFPTTTAAASQDIKENIDISLSLFFTFAGLGGMIGSWVIGMIANFAGIRLGMSFLILMAMNILIITLLIWNQGQKSLSSLD